MHTVRPGRLFNQTLRILTLEAFVCADMLFLAHLLKKALEEHVDSKASIRCVFFECLSKLDMTSKDLIKIAESSPTTAQRQTFFPLFILNKML